MQNILKKAVIYCRVSTKEQVEEGNSLTTQERLCRDYALKNGYEICQVFIEQGESAKTVDRTELQRLLNYCAFKKNQISVVIAYKLDRISRNTDDYSQIRILLKRYNIEIKFTSENFENTPSGRFMENIIANVAQFDNDVRTERSVGGMREAVREGRYIWRAPLGFSNIRTAGKCNIAPNEISLLIKKVFEQVATGLFSVDEIHRNITKGGLITRSGKATSKSHFHSILRNELYVGWIIKFGERHKGTFKPIISEELFNSVQYMLKKRKRSIGVYKFDNSDFPLRRFVRNQEGLLLTGAWSKGRAQKYPYYRFIGESISIKKNTLEQSFVKHLNKYSLCQEYYVEFKRLLEENLVKKTHDRRKIITKVIATINALREKQNLLIQKNLKGIVNDFVLQQQLDLVEKEILDLNLQLSTTPNKQYEFSELLKKASAFLKNPGDIWAESTFDIQIKLQWFNFPLGINYDGKYFRTNKICRLFNLKQDILSQMSYIVRFKELPLNKDSVTNLPPSSNSDEGLWDQIGNELVYLNEIFNSKP